MKTVNRPALLLFAVILANMPLGYGALFSAAYQEGAISEQLWHGSVRLYWLFTLPGRCLVGLLPIPFPFETTHTSSGFFADLTLYTVANTLGWIGVLFSVSALVYKLGSINVPEP